MPSIKETLSSWGFEVDLNFFGEHIVTWVCPRSKVKQVHFHKTTAEDYLQTPVTISREYCSALEPATAPSGSITQNALELKRLRAHAATIEELSKNSLFDALKRIPQDPAKSLSPHQSAKSFEGIYDFELEQRMKRELKELSEIVEAMVSEDNAWNFKAPKDLSQPESLVYVRPRFLSDWENTRLWSYLYGNVTENILIVPRSFLRFRTPEQVESEEGWTPIIGTFAKRNPGIKVITSLCGHLIKAWAPVLESDDDAIKENFSVFSKIMSFEDALNAARLV